MMCVQHLEFPIHIFLPYSKRRWENLFISYLTDYRMDIAAEMILKYDRKELYQLREKVGYLDVKLFQLCF